MELVALLKNILAVCFTVFMVYGMNRMYLLLNQLKG